MSFSDLPSVNAALNALSAAWLTAGYVFIKRGKRVAHRNCMVSALITSVLFLIAYLTYHVAVRAVTRFLEPAWFLPIYLAVLLTHTVLAMVIVPLLLVTVIRAARQQFDRHKAIARWAWPLWMCVSVTGVLVYFLLYRIFPQH